MTSLTFHVTGTPAPKGSMKGFAFRRKDGGLGVAMTRDNAPKARPWIALVTDAATQAMAGREVMRGPVRLEVVFAIARPKGHMGKRGLRPSAPKWPATKPDLDKLVRQIGDCLKGLVYDEDSRIVSTDSAKVYADGVPPGAVVLVSEARETHMNGKQWLYREIAGVARTTASTEGA